MANGHLVKGAGSVVLACLLAACAGSVQSRDAAGRPATTSATATSTATSTGATPGSAITATAPTAAITATSSAASAVATSASANATTAAPERPAGAITLGGIAFNSLLWQVKLRALPPGVTAPALRQELQAALDGLDAVLSTYRPDSELMRFNATPPGEWIAASPVLLQSLQVASEVSGLSDGAYDVTVGPLVELWGFGARPAPAVVPTPEAVAAVKARVDWRRIEVDAARGRLRRNGDVAADLSSLGEGAGADVMAAVLEARGLHDYLVRIAGTSRQRGQRPGGGPWMLAIERPDGSGEAGTALLAPDSVVSTSGAYRNVRIIGGQAWTHTLDPATGYPVRHAGVAVTIVLPSAAGALRADALATALNALGPVRGLALATREGWAVRYVEREGSGFRVRWSPAFQPFATE